MLDLEGPLPDDPYSLYARLRSATPRLALTPRGPGGPRVRVLSRYEDCVRVLRDPHVRLAAVRHPRGGAGTRLLPGLLSFHDASASPRDQRRCRLAARALASVALEPLWPVLAARILELLEQAGEKGELDAVEGLARPLALAAASEALGVAREDEALLGVWAPEAVDALDPGASRCRDRAAAALEALSAYFEEHVRRLRRQGPACRGPLAMLLAAREDGCGLSEEETVDFCVQLALMGIAAGEAAVAAGVAALVGHPVQRERLVRDPSLAVAAVEEALRWESPFQMTARVAERPFRLAGGVPGDPDDGRVEAGEVVVLLLGSANRDPEFFAAPEAFRVGRGGPPHLAFGFGPRLFLGSALVRIQAQLALRLLARRFPRLREGDQPARRRPSALMRRLDHLPVALDGG